MLPTNRAERVTISKWRSKWRPCARTLFGNLDLSWLRVWRVVILPLSSATAKNRGLTSMARLLLAALTALLASTPVLSQDVDPLAAVQELLRQHMIEGQEDFQDRQRQRQLDQEEHAYDRQMCLQVGYTGPDVEQCVRDSAAWRRGYRPDQPSAPVDFSVYGTPAPDRPQAAPTKTPSSRADVTVRKNGGIFVVPVEINGAITLEFGVDSGAADVSIPLDVFSTLKRTGTLKD